MLLKRCCLAWVIEHSVCLSLVLVVLKMSEKNSQLEAERAQSQQQLAELHSKCDSLRQQMEELVLVDCSKMAVDEHINAMAALKQYVFVSWSCHNLRSYLPSSAQLSVFVIDLWVSYHAKYSFLIHIKMLNVPLWLISPSFVILIHFWKFCFDALKNWVESLCLLALKSNARWEDGSCERTKRNIGKAAGHLESFINDSCCCLHFSHTCYLSQWLYLSQVYCLKLTTDSKQLPESLANAKVARDSLAHQKRILSSNGHSRSF